MTPETATNPAPDPAPNTGPSTGESTGPDTGTAHATGPAPNQQPDQQPDEAPDAAFVLLECEDGIARLTMNRPGAYNALSTEMIAALQDRLDAIAADPAIKVVVLTGAGGRFCAGHDIKQMRARTEPDYFRRVFQKCSAMMQTIVTLPQPVIARVEGMATAAGCQLVASCDLAVAARDAHFATPGVNIGLFCSTPMVAVSRNVPRKKMMEMLLTGEMIDAAGAVDYGLINRAVPLADLDGAVLDLARRITDKSPLVMKIGKEAFYRQLEMPLAEAYAYTSEVMTANMLTLDAAEGMTAFIEKRAPIWKGA